MSQKKSVVVTGVSTGIGWGISKVLLSRGFNVYGTVRKESDGTRLQNEFGSSYTPLLLDITDTSAIHRAAGEVGKQLGSGRLFGLVNNAGISVAGPLLHLPLEDVRRQLDVNLLAPLAVAQAFAPLLGTDPKRQGIIGRIVNISSVGGKLAVPFLGAYNASKFGLEGMSGALRRELLIYGIDVVVIGPGSVQTAIWDKAENEDWSLYADTAYAASLQSFRKLMVQEGRKGLTPERVGQTVHLALTARKPRTRYAVVPQRFKNWTVPSLLPDRLVDALIGKQFGLTGKSPKLEAESP